MNNKYVTMYGYGRNQYLIISRLTTFIVFMIFLVINALVLTGLDYWSKINTENASFYLLGFLMLVVACPVLFLDFFLFYFFKKSFFRAKLVELTPNKVSELASNASNYKKTQLAEMYLTFLKVQLDDDERIATNLLKIDKERDVLQSLSQNPNYACFNFAADFKDIADQFDDIVYAKDLLNPDDRIENYLRNKYGFDKPVKQIWE